MILNQKGYVIQISLIVFALIIGVLIFPVKFPILKETAECRVGIEVDPEKEPAVFLPPIVNVGVGNPTNGEVNGGWDEASPNAEYVLIRKNVPIFANTTDPNFSIGYPDFIGKDVGPNVVWPIIADVDYLGRNADVRHTLKYPGANQSGFDVYYPNSGGEMDINKTIVDRTGKTISWLTLRTEGILLFVHLGPDGKAIKLNYGLHIYYLVDLYQDKKMYEAANKGYQLDDLFLCLDKRAPAQPQVVEPDQQKSSTKNQLQLQWFVFEGAPGMSAHCKPAIYLYPQRKQLVNVKVNPRGEISYTDPVYDPDRGWTVWAEPGGDLLSALSNQPSAKKYDYLYYESKLLDSEIKKPEKGWVVKYGELEQLLNKVLPELGLNPKEAGDFKGYWLTKLPDSPYYFVGLVDKAQRDYLEALSVSPQPDTSIRFSLYFEALETSKVVEEPVIHTPKRTGFTLVDWGGMIKLHPGTPFTCSQ